VLDPPVGLVVNRLLEEPLLVAGTSWVVRLCPYSSEPIIMTDEEIDLAWSRAVAELAADGLVTAGFVLKGDIERATEIIAEEVRVRLVIGDRPDRTNLRYRSS
jgi:hypothetical protein